jgi:HPt (histidine-containing phosphotransfer) domain-containing protein
MNRAANADPLALDESALKRLRRVAELSQSTDLVPRLMDVFLEDTAARLDRLRSAATHRDDKALRDLAHSIRGGAATLGAGEVVRVCAAIERFPAAWTTSRAMQRIDALVVAVEHARAAFGRFKVDATH